ncbi:glycogen synthase kinase-3 alpha [Trypanosoma grayi]|uniref:glycogen synthase kinase-3 alpha n=1 Tax=Trypanosoma grayi TaxID=71804 RepID=UPI0004F43622|nr:glycogen synthase kinase-3 alpha [Trypanosoma grayi]KEG10465.1 glycogen synthase kinase-3 alpha [Trypanosoma grayi]
MRHTEAAESVNTSPLFTNSEVLQESPHTQNPGSTASEQATYEPLRVLGRGSFGVVMMARVRGTGRTVAVKKVLFDGRLHHRELTLLRDHLGPQARCGEYAMGSHGSQHSSSNNSNSISKSLGSNAAVEAGSTPNGYFTVVPTTLPYHPNIVQLLDHFSACGPNGEQYLYIVMDYLPLDIHRLHYMYVRQSQQRMPLILLKAAMFQLARALVFLHARGICHRDVKPSNVLIDPETGLVKLCDFGSAKVMQPLGAKGPREKNVSYICSRYYRAPELLLGSLYYHLHVDMWAYGCVLAELLCGNVLFKGATTVDQMAEIFKVLGAPSRKELYVLNPQTVEAIMHTSETCFGEAPLSPSNADAGSSDYLQRYHNLSIKSMQWQSVLPPSTPPAAVSLIGQLLRYTPDERLSAKEVLEHHFFDELFADDARLPSGAPFPVSMFQVTAEESEILPQWLLERMATAEKLAERCNTSHRGQGVDQ